MNNKRKKNTSPKLTSIVCNALTSAKIMCNILPSALLKTECDKTKTCEEKVKKQ
jgi:hypothetical protein